MVSDPAFYIDCIPVYIKESLPSTNVAIKAYPDQELVLLANRQEQGKGSHGRVWESEEGGLYYSYASRKTSLIEGFSDTLTLEVGAGLKAIVEQEAKLCVELKEPNDLLIDQKKCAGILVEGVQKSGEQALDWLIIGIGLNLNQRDFSETIKKTATSLQIESAKAYNRNRFIKLITRMLKDVLSRY